MSSNKSLVRERFRDGVFKRAGWRCQGPGCSFKSTPERAVQDLDAHHITNRNEMPNGGYVVENGVSLCASCHQKAEIFHQTGTTHPGFSPGDLYVVIGSSLEKARESSARLKS